MSDIDAPTTGEPDRDGSTTETPEQGDTESVSRNDPLGASYYKLFAGTVVSNLGDGMATVAYPWLASAITRNPILIALVAVAQRLPWLLFTLPAGVLTDRVDRRKAMVAMDVLRGVSTLVIAFAVLDRQDVLPGPAEVEAVTGTQSGLFLLILAATLLLGMAEVLRDNANQTIMPSIVRPHQLEKANGRIWSIEGVMQTFVGPPLGSILLLAAFSVPFFVDAGTFFIAAAMVFTIPGSFRAKRDETEPKQNFRQDLSEGVRWLMGHPLLRPMAIILGLMNAAAMIHGATFVLFAQDVMGVGPFVFGIIGFGGAIGGLIGGWIAPSISQRFGSGTALAMSVGVMTIVPLLIGLIATWPVVLVLFGVESLFIILWNVITVSLRQTIIPEDLLGRVNSVYRFFAWGMIPFGAVIGGTIVWLVERVADRDLALRSTWFAASAIFAGIFVFVRTKLTTDKIEAARAAATASSS